MSSTFSGIELGKRSLIAHNTAMQTVGHNLSNASTEGYSRQRVEMKPVDPLYDPGLNREARPGQVGQGVGVASIRRVRDELLQGRIVSQTNEKGYWEARDKYILMVEEVYNEPEDISVRSMMDKFWDSWQELSLHPDQLSARQAVVKRSETLMDGIHTRFNSLTSIREMLDDDVKVTVGEVNTFLKDIGKLNEQILKVEAMGDNPNDLYDQRDLLVEKLSSLVQIEVENRDPDEFQIHTGGYHLIQGRSISPLALEPDPQNEGYHRVVRADNGEDAYLPGGKLGALVELRDVDVKEQIQNLDLMTVNFIDLVNEIHGEGYGMGGQTQNQFFSEYPFVNNLAGNYDSTGDGEYDSTYIFRMTGSNTLKANDHIGLEGNIILNGPEENIEIPYFPTDTVGDLVHRINHSGAEVVARLDRQGFLEVKALPAADPGNPDFVIRYMEDSGEFLTGYAGLLEGSGPDNAYNYNQANGVLSIRGGGTDYAVAPLSHPSGWIEVNRNIVKDPGLIAAGFGVSGRPAEAGDGTAAVEIASLRNHPILIGREKSFDDYFADAVAEVGLKGEVAQISLETQDAIMKDLTDLRDSISGVNIDEELSNMIKFQHGYNAAARFISNVNEMLDTIINRLGV